jgi:hypothetical protein
MAPMNPHQPPKVEIPAESRAGGASTRAQTDAAADELIGPKLMQKGTATGDRYEVAGPSRAYPTPPPSPLPKQTTVASRGPAATPSGGVRSTQTASLPPTPEQFSTLPEEADSTAPKARTATNGPRYPASRY